MLAHVSISFSCHISSLCLHQMCLTYSLFMSIWPFSTIRGMPIKISTNFFSICSYYARVIANIQTFTFNKIIVAQDPRIGSQKRHFCISCSDNCLLSAPPNFALFVPKTSTADLVLYSSLWLNTTLPECAARTNDFA